MKIRTVIIGLGLVLGACTSPTTTTPITKPAPTPSEAWVIEGGPSYSGPRGQNHPRGTGEHYVTCVPANDLIFDRTQRDRWREVVIPAEHAYDETYRVGALCPSGRTRLTRDIGG